MPLTPALEKNIRQERQELSLFQSENFTEFRALQCLDCCAFLIFKLNPIFVSRFLNNRVTEINGGIMVGRSWLNTLHSY